MNDLTVYIALGDMSYLGVNNQDQLVLFTTKKNVIRDYVPLGKITKEKIEMLKRCIDELATFAI